MVFLLNEKVRFLHESGYGVIKSVLAGNRYLVENESGIELVVYSHALGKIYSEEYSTEIVYKDSTPIKQKSKEPQEDPEIDLHIEELIDHFSRLSNYEILQCQIRYLDTFVQRMLSRNCRRFVVIHGVGEGVLKNEVRVALKKYTGVSARDANAQKYGKGATLVEVNYNLR
jgi:dsDNA-specific endonuclease/ATPase MutS2